MRKDIITIPENPDNYLVELVEVLEGIDENKVAAEINEISMLDNQGGRIYY